MVSGFHVNFLPPPQTSSATTIGQLISQCFRGASAMTCVIAVDLDDVLAQTNAAAAQWHNATYGTQIDLSTFYYYHWFKNPGWGTPRETLQKCQAFYQSRTYADAAPVPGAVASIRAIRALGVRLVIVTARDASQRDITRAYVQKHFPGCFDDIHFTGELAALKGKWKSGKPLSGGKAEVCHALGARLLIDDSSENALQCAQHQPPIRTLVFGDYEWNQRISTIASDVDRLSYAQRRELDQSNWWERDPVALPADAHRVVDWPQAVTWIRQHLDELR